MEGGQVYQKVNAAWKETCRVIFGDEVGELRECGPWLSEYLGSFKTAKSVVSGKDVSYAVPHYPDSARFISQEEIDFNRKFEPLNINEIKDMDSIIESLQDRFIYTGNVLLENSRFVSESSNISDSFYVFNSRFISNSKNIAYCSRIRYGENLFGIDNGGKFKFNIRIVHANDLARCFELVKSIHSSDCYYSFSLVDCADVMFSFNLNSRRNTIGNLQLSGDKYQGIKQKLLEELRGHILKNKEAPSLLDFVLDKKQVLPEAPLQTEDFDPVPVESAFRSVTSTVLGKELRGMDDYEKWLMQSVTGIRTAKSAMSGSKITIAGFPPYTLIPKDRVVTEKEGWHLGEILKLEESEVSSLEHIRNSLWKIAFFTPEARFRSILNIGRAAVVRDSANCYAGAAFIENEFCAFSYRPRQSRYTFGSELVHSSNTCIHCYYSAAISRCFEVDSCSNSSDLYFSHNCENVNDSMFCFNRKNLKYAIGNASIGPEKYRPLKKSILEQITDELEAKKSFRWNIYNIASKS